MRGSGLPGSGGCRGGGGLRILDVGFQPVVHFPEHMKHRFARRVTVSLQRQQHEADRATVPFDSAEKALTLQGPRAGVVVSLAVDEQKRRLDFVRIREGRHLVIDLGRLPVSAVFILKAERSEGAIVGATARDAGFEEVGMGQKIDGHERAVGMAHNGDALGVNEAEASAFVDGGLGARDELIDVGIVGLGLALTDDGNGAFWRTA